MEEKVREIEVRSLSGESTTLSISPNKIVQDLKLHLIQCFHPAASSPNFHLFLRGVKLDSQRQIGSHSICSGEFLVLVPFAKKGRFKNQQLDRSTSMLQVPHQSAVINLEDSTWCDMIKDLSYLRNTSDNENQTDSKTCDRNFNGEPFTANWKNRNDKSDVVDQTSGTSYLPTKRKSLLNEHKEEVLSEGLISSLIQLSDGNILDKEVYEKFLKVLESVNCLSDVQSRNCLLLRETNLRGSNEPLHSCVCPPWLKITMKAFTFLNILTGFLLVRQERVTLDFLKVVLHKFGEFGLPVGFEDLKDLSVLCPKVVSFADIEGESRKLDNMLVIFKFSREQGREVNIPDLHHPAGNPFPLSKIMHSMKKREALFKRNLMGLFNKYMRAKKCGYDKVASLEELVLSTKKASSSLYGNKAKESCSSSWRSTSLPIQTRCHDTHPLSPMEMIEHLRNGIGSQGQMVHVEEITARVATFGEFPDELSENAVSALKSLGITRLYSHQAESIRASLAGKNVIVATLTSSGKSLCYNIPVLEALSLDVLSCAIYLFPTKALAQDQLRALLSMIERLDANINIGIYDGDTSRVNRIWQRDNVRVLITNPDMLHMSILPCHGQFERLLSNLRFVVIDEAHSYKGAFGCHTALILRRLGRLCSHVYGSAPSFVLCTATSANPREHAMELANLSELELIQKDGSPSGPKSFILWNPPLYPKSMPERSAGRKDSTKSAIVMRRSSPILEISLLLAEMVQHGLRCIAFCKTRKLCELVLSYTHEILKDSAPHLMDSICAYRGGYIAEDRRRIESEFFGGKLCGIAATNALELGIDVGHIDVTLHLGFPGSVASLWQQAGRSGRRGRPSLSVYVAFESPLDQYFMRFPEKLFRSPVECCHVDSQSHQVLEQHLICAAREHPLSLVYDVKFFGSGLKSAILALEGRGYISSDASCASSSSIWSYIGREKMPSHAISIRAIESERYKVIDMQNNEVIEEIEESKAFFQVYEGAVYMNQGKNYLVKELNLSSKIAFCQDADLKYYTKTRDYTDIHVIGGDTAYIASASSTHSCRTSAQGNSCKVITTWFGFRRIWRDSNRVFDTVELSLPKYSYESQAVWIRVPQSVKLTVEKANLSFHAGLHAASHAVLNIVPLYIICNSSDLASECANPHETRYFPERILLYDPSPGGTGLSMQVQPLFTEMLTAALQLLTSCYCASDIGCPNCIQSLACHEYNEILHKDAAIMIIKGVLDAEKEIFGGFHGPSGTM
ncbi:hypothetical protein Nepgr_018871 [Nepenthes gracilis]|uniref:Uncharacterized protein n=1 Tax=Nepenthes gracilis TaxID=150966 RepID=A0AAD3SS97_NEPGR|nr:hypothetical protein Nepgr_018871 [Nepenthes gracilis]